MTRRPRIGLYFSTTLGFSRQIVPGITNYAHNLGRWELVVRTGTTQELESGEFDGLIGMFIHPEQVEALRLKTPRIVNFSNHRGYVGIPRVGSDDVAVGRRAAEYLVARGYRSFGFLGWSGHQYSEDRRQGFCESLERLVPGAEIDVRDGDRRSLVAWLKRLPRPVAILGCNDERARQVIEAALEADLAVPSDVAVLGVDNDDMACALAPVPLSSVVLATRKIGFEGAKSLDRWIREGIEPPRDTAFAPAGIVSRASTEWVAASDPVVSKALRVIHEQAYRDLPVSEVAALCGVGRRTLERRFQETIRRSPHDEIQRLRLDRARQLLAETDLTIDEVATRSGFTTARILSSAFRRELGLTPSAFKRSAQLV